ncbi:hypothetical protein L195_g021082 [Trifolium pratense]|uniref:Uncharacterized protein n=1 Tax=Trifolium pratense TaxID=57577 RepID=A0A2K3N486_TRIPR|nr:hypothetical protein L195_g021082 [Trifolium pratense]
MHDPFGKLEPVQLWHEPGHRLDSKIRKNFQPVQKYLAPVQNCMHPRSFELVHPRDEPVQTSELSGNFNLVIEVTVASAVRGNRSRSGLVIDSCGQLVMLNSHWLRLCSTENVIVLPLSSYLMLAVAILIFLVIKVLAKLSGCVNMTEILMVSR